MTSVNEEPGNRKEHGRWQHGTTNTTSDPLLSFFRSCTEKHLLGLRVRGDTGMSLCPFHHEHTPSFSVDFVKGVAHCFGCGWSGGVKDFALAVGEPWGIVRYSTYTRARVAVQARRRAAEAQARAILQGRKDMRDASLWVVWGEANTAAGDTVDLLALFWRHPHLAEEFAALVEGTEREYSDALFRMMLAEQRWAGEVVA